MQTIQKYILTINDLFEGVGDELCSATAVVSIMEGSEEIDRLKFSGKVGTGGQGYRHGYEGKPGLVAKIDSGPGTVSMESVSV